MKRLDYAQNLKGTGLYALDTWEEIDRKLSGDAMDAMETGDAFFEAGRAAAFAAIVRHVTGCEPMELAAREKLEAM